MRNVSHAPRSVNPPIPPSIPHTRSCDYPGCTGTQEYRQAVTCFGEIIARYECRDCGKTTDPRLVIDMQTAAAG